MLNQVVKAINQATRRVTLTHPNGIECAVCRKVHARTDEAPFGELPTIGGMGVIGGDDELEYTWEPLGEAKILFAPGQQPRGNVARTGVMLGYQPEPVEARIECTADPDSPEWFEPDRGMLVKVFIGGGLFQNFRIVEVTSNVSIPPYTRTYVLDPNADVDEGENEQEGAPEGFPEGDALPGDPEEGAGAGAEDDDPLLAALLEGTEGM